MFNMKLLVWSYVEENECSLCSIFSLFKRTYRGRHGGDRMVVGFTTTYVISAYHHWCSDVVSSNLDLGEVYNIMWYSLSVTCDRSVVFSWYSVSSAYKIDRHDIAKILFKVALNTIKQTNKQTNINHSCAKLFCSLHSTHNWAHIIIYFSLVCGSF